MSEEEREHDAPDPATDPAFGELLEKLRASRGFDVRDYKAASLARRVRARMQQVHVETFETYGRFLDEHADEYGALFNTILINVTGFFRDPESWRVLATEVIPKIADAARDSRSIRVWSAGCSTGEETYSVALALAEHLGERAASYAVRIYGTDVDEDALATARHGMYRADQLTDVPDGLLARYFAREGQVHRLRREVRRWCIFGIHNLAQSPPLSHIDLLLCRNLLIYFTSPLQQRVLARFHYAIRPGGYLFLGRSESLQTRSRQFTPVNAKWRIFQRTSPARATTPPDRADVPRAHAGEPPDVPAPAVRAQRAIDALPVAVMVIDMDDTVLLCNPAAERVFDVPVAAAVARKFRDLDVSYRIEGLRAKVEDVKTRLVHATLEDVRFMRRNGDAAHATVSIVPLVDGQRAVGVVVSAIDATEQARVKDQMTRIAEQHATAIEELQSTNEELETTNEELQSTNEELETTVEELQATNSELAAVNAELEARTADVHRVTALHQSVLDGLDDALVVVDRDLVVVSWNHVSERLWGLRAEHVLGRHFPSLPLGDAAARARSAVERVVASGQPDDVLVPCSGAREEPRQAALRLTPLRDGSGTLIGALAVITLPDGAAGVPPDDSRATTP